MNVEGANGSPVFAFQRLDYNLLRQRTLKRKLGASVPLHLSGEFSYPSPPMSSPPSPVRTLPPEHSASGGRPTSPSGSTSAGPITTFVPALATTLPAAPPPLPPTFLNQTFGYGTFTNAPPTTVLQPAPVGAFQSEPTRTTDQSVPSTSIVAGPSSSARGGRRSKAHVASACVNCKRAHLSCDIQRPCARCVASGKQDTCVDVQHKKRGRPRLREEGEFSVEQMVSEPATQASRPVGPSQTPTRPLAGTRNRRAESFRSLRSQTSEDSPSYAASTSSYPPVGILQSPFSAQQPPTPSTGRFGYEVATAFLNLDFIIMKANRAFEQIMMGGQDVQGRQIADIAASADNEGFHAIRNRLRAERESREPAYMPPILHPGQDPVEGVSETDVDQFTRGFSDHTYIWTHGQLGAAAQRFPARVRLAKASTYFVVITLPSFRPVDLARLQPSAPIYGGPLVPGPPLQAMETFIPPRQTAQSAPPMAYYPLQGATAPIPPQPPPGTAHLTTSRTSTYPQPVGPYQPQRQPYPVYQPTALETPRLPMAEPSFGPTSFTPRTASREYVPPTGTAELQLPPIMGSPASGPSGRQPAEALTQQASSEEEEEDAEGGRRLGSPRKRRRMGIDDVLQR